jgi:hypothetical protein
MVVASSNERDGGEQNASRSRVLPRSANGPSGGLPSLHRLCFRTYIADDSKDAG